MVILFLGLSIFVLFICFIVVVIFNVKAFAKIIVRLSIIEQNVFDKSDYKEKTEEGGLIDLGTYPTYDPRFKN